MQVAIDTTKLRDKVEKLGKALQTAQEHYEAILSILEAEGVDYAKLGKRALDTFGRLWLNQYGEAYVFNWARDRSQTKRLLVNGLTIERLEEKMATYLLLRDPFITQQRHPFGLFITRINSLGESKSAMAPARPYGCQHRPACASDIEHTARMAHEMRG